VIDLRIYRAAFLPALLVAVVCAFSLTDRPRASSATLAPGAFDTLRAFGRGNPPPPDSLRELAASFPSRLPGSRGDQRLAERVGAFFRDKGFRVDRIRREATTIEGDVELETVVGVRTGLSSRRIVVVAHRDAVDPGSEADLSGTAALLELARVFRVTCDEQAAERQCGRELSRTLVLVSTSGATGGAGGARAWAQSVGEAPVDAVIVLGDVAGEDMRKPWVVPWSNGHPQPPLALRRTVEAALRREAGGEPGGSRAISQWIRRAIPLSPGEQPELAAAGLPAVEVSVSGERGPRPTAPVLARRMEDFGRAVLRAISAVDAAGVAADGTVGPAFEDTGAGIVTVRRVLPGWTVRLLVAALLLPALLAAVDGVARVRRRRQQVLPWLGWVAAAALPFALAWAWARLLGLVALDVPPVPLPPEAASLGPRGWASLASTSLVAAIGWFVLRPMAVSALRRRETDGAGGAAAAVGTVLCLIAIAVWLSNPYAAALLVPAVHLGLLLAAPEPRLRGWRAVVALVLAVAPYVAVLVYYGTALGLGPLELAWVLLAAAAGGHFPAAACLAGAAVAGCLACAMALALRRPAVPPPRGGDAIVTRGPVGYAGPGSLGGTESALRR
jgi:hypothetical protein